jgi:hypothetical protein
VILVRGKVESVLNERLQRALNLVTECKDANLSINPKKAIVIPLTRIRKFNLVDPMMGEVTVEFSNEIYLGVAFDL